HPARPPPAVAHGHAIKGAIATPWNTAGVPAKRRCNERLTRPTSWVIARHAQVAHGHAIEGTPATPGAPKVFQQKTGSLTGTPMRARRRPPGTPKVFQQKTLEEPMTRIDEIAPDTFRIS